MARRLRPTLADYLVIAVSPVLIMAMVGSLVFFLLEVFYHGDFPGRLQYILALFVMAAVLIGRISIESGTDRATLFALPLAVVTGLAIHRFVADASLLNWLLLGLIWWSTHRLTWDCTFLDASKDVSNEGLLQTIGQGRGRESGTSDHDPENEPEGVTSREDRKSRPAWWASWLDRRARPNAPGVWIVYFSLAALPVFGIGQGLIAAENMASRRYVFWLLCIYVASGLGLLVNTSFLGLRRYLRQRRLQMPAAMAGLWIAIGSVLIVGLLGGALFLPRPNAGDPFGQLLARLESPEQDPSRYALGREGVRQDDPQREGFHKQEAKEGDRGQGAVQNAQGGEGKSGTQDASQSQQGEPSGRSQDTKGQQKSEDRQSSQGPQGEKADRSPSQDRNHSEKPADQEATQSRPEATTTTGQSPDDQRSQGEGRTEEMPSQRVSLPELSISRLVEWLGPFLRWLLYGVVFLGVGYWLWRAREQVMAAFRELLAGWREFWKRWFGHHSPDVASVTSDEARPRPPRPLSAFVDPFATGEVCRMTPAELVRYTFAAMEAWARENDCARQPDETPHEFARKVGERATSVSREVCILADLYCRVAYAPERLSAVTAHPIEQLWQLLLDTSHGFPTAPMGFAEQNRQDP